MYQEYYNTNPQIGLLPTRIGGSLDPIPSGRPGPGPGCRLVPPPLWYHHHRPGLAGIYRKAGFAQRLYVGNPVDWMCPLPRPGDPDDSEDLKNAPALRIGLVPPIDTDCDDDWWEWRMRLAAANEQAQTAERSAALAAGKPHTSTVVPPPNPNPNRIPGRSTVLPFVPYAQREYVGPRPRLPASANAPLEQRNVPVDHPIRPVPPRFAHPPVYEHPQRIPSYPRHPPGQRHAHAHGHGYAYGHGHNQSQIDPRLVQTRGRDACGYRRDAYGVPQRQWPRITVPYIGMALVPDPDTDEVEAFFTRDKCDAKLVTEDPICDMSSRVFHPPPIGTERSKRDRTSTGSSLDTPSLSFDMTPSDESDDEPYRLIPSLFERFPGLSDANASEGEEDGRQAGVYNAEDDDGPGFDVWRWLEARHPGQECAESTCYDDETRKLARPDAESGECDSGGIDACTRNLTGALEDARCQPQGVESEDEEEVGE